VREQIVLATAELASNLVKHAGRGDLTLKTLQTNDRVGIEVEAKDTGPGMVDVEKSITDGYSTVGTLGYGLGTVNRLMDEMDISSMRGQGTRVICRRWLRLPDTALIPGLWDVGAATRSRRSASANGDAFVIRKWQGKLLVGVIDGLGHGELAQQAALAAQNYVQAHYDLSLEKIFTGVSRACRATRGVVMALARFESSTLMTFANVGNVEARAWSGSDRIPLIVSRGILGSNPPNVTVQEHKWKANWLLVLHTDGLRTHWQWGDFPGVEHEPAQGAASKLLGALAVEDDDATVLTARSTQP
jgi:hypothetical protein